MADEQKKSDLKSTNGFYVGREAKGEKGKKKDGTEFQRYSLKFKPFIDSQKTFSVTAFHPIKNAKSFKLDELQENIQYSISYSERVVEGREHPLKTLAGIYTFKGDKAPAKETPKQSGEQLELNSEVKQPIKTVPVVSNVFAEIEKLLKFDSFIIKYIEQVPVEKQSINHMAGTYLASYHKESFKELFARCKIAISAQKGA